MKNLSLLLTALALVAGMAVVALSLPVTSPVPDATPASLSVEAPAEAPLLGIENGDCDSTDPLALPGTDMACCLDQCQVDTDCFFRCGGQPGKCVMNNPCCTECECGSVSSFAS